MPGNASFLREFTSMPKTVFTGQSGTPTCFHRWGNDASVCIIFHRGRGVTMASLMTGEYCNHISNLQIKARQHLLQARSCPVSSFSMQTERGGGRFGGSRQSGCSLYV